MKKDDDYITPNEINKYSYCPYQWYYEKIYGIKQLRARKRQLNEQMGYTDSSKSNFARGIAFHNNHRYIPVGRIIWRIVILLVVAAVLFLLAHYFYGFPLALVQPTSPLYRWLN